MVPGIGWREVSPTASAPPPILFGLAVFLVMRIYSCGQNPQNRDKINHKPVTESASSLSESQGLVE